MAADPDALVVLLTRRTELEAQLVVATLRDSGIDAHAFGLGGLGTGLSLPRGLLGVPVQVRRRDLDAARAALADHAQAGEAGFIFEDDDDDEDEPATVDDPAPQRRSSPMPLPAAAGFLVALLLVLLLIIAAVVMVL